MICAFVLEVVGAGKACLVAHLFAGACHTVVPIIDVKSAGETNVLIFPLFYHIRAMRILLRGVLNAGRDVENHLISTYKRDWCSWLHRSTWAEMSMSIAGVVATPTTSSMVLTPLLCRG
jgi:hypothetical protein